MMNYDEKLIDKIIEPALDSPMQSIVEIIFDKGNVIKYTILEIDDDRVVVIGVGKGKYMGSVVPIIFQKELLLNNGKVREKSDAHVQRVISSFRKAILMIFQQFISLGESVNKDPTIIRYSFMSKDCLPDIEKEYKSRLRLSDSYLQHSTDDIEDAFKCIYYMLEDAYEDPLHTLRVELKAETKLADTEEVYTHRIQMEPIWVFDEAMLAIKTTNSALKPHQYLSDIVNIPFFNDRMVSEALYDLRDNLSEILDKVSSNSNIFSVIIYDIDYDDEQKEENDVQRIMECN